jgi:hypothetical protein
MWWGGKGRPMALPKSAPNQALEPTPYSFRSCLASAFGAAHR